MVALIPLFPFLGFAINSMLGKRLPKAVSGGLASLAMLASFAVSAMLVWQIAAMEPASRAIEQTLYTWIASGDLTIDLTFRVDGPSLGVFVADEGLAQRAALASDLDPPGTGLLFTDRGHFSRANRVQRDFETWRRGSYNVADWRPRRFAVDVER